ncbi:MAG: hypothetical protein COX81_01910 [Candidatus Magasanikbacteria bacterium CG_4_10_14_0_2_um_filter_37_12]|uniref:Uncharacterized protein n=1 Tax=Candidatus Magasanikbacteria bacterium CG_4_10_14_0_2_um_filter_37_12 TaxID=1974637 RepID=A0A2M7V8C6_9BACT|nr:MAG: hypothetical protein COX81_01910 [Candidatus Magasanikbacteria bacterium CG_4_10_14_0_2_um_filter_37_12]
MHLKKFFQPNVQKIMLFFIVFITSWFLSIWTTIGCNAHECMPGFASSSFWKSIQSMHNREFFDFGYANRWAVIFLACVVMSYVLSCLILLLFSRKGKN